MRQPLKRHPGSCSFTAAHIEVEVARPHADSLVLSYVVSGKLTDIRIPPVAAAATRSDGLWRHTCFEAFVRASSGAAYYEFNFAPSTHWAAYRFSGYRSGMHMADEITNLPIELRSGSESYALQVSLELSRLSALPRNVSWRLGLSALLEHTDGRTSYWALAHPPGEPDFHHADCFAHEFSPVELS